MPNRTSEMVPAEPFATDRLVEAAHLLGDDPILVVEWRTRRILACNDAVTRVFGFDPDELLGHDTRALHVSEAAFESFGLESEAFLRSGHTTYHCQHRMRRKDGSEFPTENLVQLIHGLDEERVAVVSFVRDLSDCLSVSQRTGSVDVEAAYPLSMDVPGLVFRRVRDLQGRDRYTYIAGQLLHTIGIDPEEAQKDPAVIFNLIEPNDRQILESVIESSMKTLSAIDLIIRLHASTGDWYWLRTISRPKRLEDGSFVWDGIVLDISAEKKAQGDAAWLASHDRLTGLLNRPDFMTHVEHALEVAHRKSLRVALVHLGVRGMFKINEPV